VNAFTGTGLTAQQQAAQGYVRKLFNWRKTRRDPPREADALRPGAEYLCLLPLRRQPQGDGGAEQKRTATRSTLRVFTKCCTARRAVRISSPASVSRSVHSYPAGAFGADTGDRM
jgi:hypothetical protein